MRSERIDSIRGISVIGMILFHANYLLENIFAKDIIPLPDIFWMILGKSVAILFILVSGVSFALMSEGKGISIIWDRTLRRVAILSLAASSITIGTYLFAPEELIVWGILHFFAIASIFAPIFISFRGYNILIGIVIVIFGILTPPL